ncbi:hypothetical protein E2C01_063324 [Portunus trituberculatus]|uniref:Uncharacterized protein n=1 Tax=Portunus trituberculatus TaxID=210409 RepID=A0A5B7HH99_PORTR|nr:hypothetical protein [Portunus trituberculatus]
MAIPNPASESPSGEGPEMSPGRTALSLVTQNVLTPRFLNFFFINFCNIRGFRSNFQSVEHHLSSTKPHLN